MAKIADALPVEEWRRLLKRPPVRRSTKPRPALMETPADVAKRLKSGTTCAAYYGEPCTHCEEG